MIFLKGAGANAKSMASALRHNVFNGNHFFVSSSVFEIDEEFDLSNAPKPTNMYIYMYIDVSTN